VDRLREDLEDLIDRKVTLNILEIKSPDLDAQLVAEALSEQLKRRSAFRRAMKQHCENTMAAGAKGVKIIISGRLAGAEIARSERQVMGSIPLQTLQADVDYGYTLARTTYGAIGVKVWVYRGMFDEQPEPEDKPKRSRGGRR
jgi:small subunit ribosomal protein S3